MECDRQLPMARPSMRIGLLGGSFDPPHSGHRMISLMAMKKLGLDQVWWLISPINPLKTKNPWPLKKRIAQCQLKSHHPRIKITGFECERDSFYTVDSLEFLKRRFPDTDFVWIMGADNLAGFHRWYKWHDVFRLMPILVVDRPGYRFASASSQAYHFYKKDRISGTNLSGLAQKKTPCWAFMTLALNDQSSTQIRQRYKN